MGEEFMNLTQAAKYLGVSNSTVRRRMKEIGAKPIGYNPLLKKQRESKYPLSDIDKIKGTFTRNKKGPSLKKQEQERRNAKRNETRKRNKEIRNNKLKLAEEKRRLNL